MFARTYFGPRYFAPRFFPEEGASVAGVYFAPRYFAGRYFAPRYFPGEATPAPTVEGWYFPARYFAGVYFPARYFPSGTKAVPVTGGAAGGGDRRVTYALRRPVAPQRERLVIEMPPLAVGFRAYAIAGRAEVGGESFALVAQSAIRVEARTYAAQVLPVDDEEELELIALL